jgi:uncharacterized protein YndB with AHSA1/START domain
LTDAAEFGKWFGVAMKDSFAPGARARGQITEPGYEKVTFDVVVERMEKERLFSFRWHPYAVDPSVDYSQEPMTLVVFELSDDPEGTRLRVVESGFDRIPAARRAEAHRMNTEGWSIQTERVAKYVGETR